LAAMLSDGEMPSQAVVAPQAGEAEAEADVPDSRKALFDLLPAGSDLAREASAIEQRWTERLEPCHSAHDFMIERGEPTSLALPGPFGTLLVRPAGEVLWLESGRPEPALFFGR